MIKKEQTLQMLAIQMEADIFFKKRMLYMIKYERLTLMI